MNTSRNYQGLNIRNTLSVYRHNRTNLKATWMVRINQSNNWGISCELDRNMEIY